jgi:HEAT repeat protein
LHRNLLGVLVASLLLVAFFLVYFSFSDFHRSGRSHLTSLSDFAFLVGSYSRQLADSPPPFDERAFAEVMARFRAGIHREVRRRLLWTLETWGDAAGPGLVREAQGNGDPYRLVGAARGLAAIDHPRAAELIGSLLERFADDPRRFRSDFIDALGETGDAAALEVLTAIFRRHGNGIGNVLEAIGQCGGTDFLLEQLALADSPEAGRELIWPLTYTRDPRAARAVAEQLLHRDASVRVRAYSALGQTMGVEAVGPVLDVLEGVGNEYIVAAAINRVLARARNRDAPRLVPYLAGLAGHPTLGWEARYALARVGGPEAVEVLQELVGRESPDTVMEHFDILGEASLPLLRAYLRHPRAAVRRKAIHAAQGLLDPATRPLLEPLVDDPERHNRRAARLALFDLDTLELLRSFTELLPEGIGNAIWRDFRSDLDWGFRKSYRRVLEIFTAVHWAGLVLSALLGLLLVFRRVRIFEPYRFTLFVSFLLSEGLVGNFFLLGSGWRDPRQIFSVATGVHLLLLIGFLFQERARLPGELRGRFERLGGASLWLLAPLLLVLGTPLMAEGLRLAVRDILQFLPYLAMTMVAVILVLEEWAVPWRLLPRSARYQRVLGGVLAAALLWLFAGPLQLLAAQRLAVGDRDGALFAGLLILPLLWMLFYHLVHIGLLRPSAKFRVPAPPPGSRLAAVVDGDRITVRLRHPYAVRWRLVQGLAAFAVGGVSAALAGYLGGGGQSLQLALLAGVVGAALTGLLFEALVPRLLIEVRGGFMRSGIARFGITLGGGVWQRRPAFSSAIERRLAARSKPDHGLSAGDHYWLRQLLVLSTPPERDPRATLAGEGALA